MSNVENENVTDLAAFIDAENKNNDLAAKFNFQKENPVRRMQRVMNEGTKPIKPGELFHAHFISAEFANASNGYPFLRCKFQLDGNGWTMSMTHFIDRKKCGSTAEIDAAALEFLGRYGYNRELHNLKDLQVLAEIGSWTSDDGKEHLNIKRIYRDEEDYRGYQEWLKNRPERQPKKREPVSLPDDF